MDTAVQQAITSIASSVKTDGLAVYTYVLPVAFGVYIVFWGLRYGVSKLMNALRGKF